MKRHARPSRRVPVRVDRRSRRAGSWSGTTPVNQMRSAIEATLKAVEARERGLTGQIVGFRPGTLYPHIYARDSATIAPSAPVLLRPAVSDPSGRGVPRAPVRRHARATRRMSTGGRRDQPGAVSGTIGGGEIVGAKMLVVSDEEPSVVTMAYVATKAGAGPVLAAPGAGRPPSDSAPERGDGLDLRASLRSAVSVRSSAATPPTGATSQSGQGHSSGSYTKEPDDWTASIYDQAWTYRALQQLAELNRMVDQPEIAEHQRIASPSAASVGRRALLATGSRILPDPHRAPAAAA